MTRNTKTAELFQQEFLTLTKQFTHGGVSQDKMKKNLSKLFKSILTNIKRWEKELASLSSKDRKLIEKSVGKTTEEKRELVFKVKELRERMKFVEKELLALRNLKTSIEEIFPSRPCHERVPGEDDEIDWEELERETQLSFESGEEGKREELK